MKHKVYKKASITSKADELKLSRQRLSMLLNGRRNMSYPEAVRISEILKCDPTIWLKGGGTPEERRAAVETTDL